MAEIAIATTVVGWFVVPHVNQVLNKAYKFLSDGTKEKIQILETTKLGILKGLIENAEKNEEASRIWLPSLSKLKTIAYEIEDVVDKIEYKLLEQQAMGKVVNVVSKVTSFPSSKWKGGILKELDAKVTSMIGFIGPLLNNNNIQGATRTTTVSTFTGEVFGRMVERQHIIDLLTTPMLNSSDKSKFKVVAILGVGGVGKTVLASYVFNHDLICGHFGPKMWLHVPENFDEVEMTRSMVELMIPGVSFANKKLESLHKELGKRLREEQQNRFLLVLDDVWYDEKLDLHQNMYRWDRLCAPLSNGGQGSMILITSRMEKVVKLFRCDTKQFILKRLKEKDWLAIFNKHAFGTVDPPAPITSEEENLNKIREVIVAEISRKLGGLPLAASAAGDLLKHKPKGGCEIKKEIIHGNVRNSLMWSYQMLSPKFQRCIVHLSLYPRGFEFHPTSLALSWLGTGVVTEAKLEEVRHEYFDELESRSFFQKVGDESFVLHSLLHDVADTVSVNEFKRITGREAETADILDTIKHLSIEVKMLVRYKEKICGLTKLRTLFLTCSNKYSRSVAIVDRDVLKAILKKTTRLRALSLAFCSIAKLPKSIGDLTHLRFLDLSNSSVNRLPKTVCKLYHLRYLNLKNCRLDHVPKDLNKLINLRHLIVSDGATFSMIPHIGRLTALQELKEFHVKKKRGHELGQLENLDSLQGALRVVNLEKVANYSEEAHKAKLEVKKGLTELVLEWGEPVAVVGCSPSGQTMLDKLLPPPDITNLTLRGYAGVTNPSWVRVKTLVLNNCPNSRLLPPLGRLFKVFEKLKLLELRDCSELRYMPPLPTNLTKLVLYGCSQVAILTKEELQTTDVDQQKRIDFESRQVGIKEGQVKKSLMRNKSVMDVLKELKKSLEERGLPQDATSPPLTSLNRWVVKLKLEAISEKLARTPQVTHIEQLPSSLKHLQLHECFVDDSTLSECLESLTSLFSLELSKCMCITSLPSNTVCCLLSKLNVLQVTDCVLFTSLGGIRALVSLEEFKVSSCPNFLAVVPSDDVGTSRGNAFLPESLDKLRITDCRFLNDEKLNRFLMGLTQLTLLELHNCAHVTSLPSAAEMGHLRSLKHLSLKTCVDLASVEGLHVLTSLNYLLVKDCPKLLVPLQPTAAVATALAPPTIGATGDVTLASSADLIAGASSAAAPPTAGIVATTPTPFTVSAALAPPANGATSAITLASAKPSAGTATATAPTAGVVVATPTPLTVGGAISTTTTDASLIPDTPAPTGGAAFVADVVAIALAPPTTGAAPAPPVAIGVLPFTCQVNVDNLSLLPRLLSRNGLASLKMLVIESPQNTDFTDKQQGCLEQVTSLQVLSFKNCERLPSLPSNLDSLTSLKLLELQNCPELRAVPRLPESLKFINLLDCHHELDQKCQQTLYEQTLGDQVDVSFLGYIDYGDVID